MTTQDIAASGALTCVGQPEQLAGEAAGAAFKKLGATNVLCVIHQSGQNLLDRCNGIAMALGVGSQCKTGSAPSKGPACTELTLSTPNAASNPQQAIGQVTAYLQTHPGINAVMTLNNAIGTALVTSAPASKPKIATFDLNSGVEQDLKNNSMAFAIDQQQYLQGYLPIVFLVPVQQGQRSERRRWHDRRQRAAGRDQREHRQGRRGDRGRTGLTEEH